MADPFLKFFTSDWRSDPRLRMCSPAARGLWIELICLMHEAMPYGHLRVHGQPPNEAQLASLTGIREAELPDLIAELELHGVFSRTREGVIYSRKLVRMAAKSAKARKNGKAGGNPSLRKETEKPPSLNLQDKPPDKPHIPEAIFQKKRDANASSSPDGFDDFWEAFPRKVEKKAAKARYDRAVKGGVPPERILEAARRYAKSETVLRGFSKHPTTWLNAGCWDDEEPRQASEGAAPDNPNRAFLRKVAGGSN